MSKDEDPNDKSAETTSPFPPGQETAFEESTIDGKPTSYYVDENGEARDLYLEQLGRDMMAETLLRIYQAKPRPGATKPENIKGEDKPGHPSE